MTQTKQDVSLTNIMGMGMFEVLAPYFENNQFKKNKYTKCIRDLQPIFDFGGPTIIVGEEHFVKGYLQIYDCITICGLTLIYSGHLGLTTYHSWPGNRSPESVFQSLLPSLSQSNVIACKSLFHSHVFRMHYRALRIKRNRIEWRKMKISSGDREFYGLIDQEITLGNLYKTKQKNYSPNNKTVLSHFKSNLGSSGVSQTITIKTLVEPSLLYDYFLYIKNNPKYNNQIKIIKLGYYTPIVLKDFLNEKVNKKPKGFVLGTSRLGLNTFLSEPVGYFTNIVVDA